MSGFKIFGFSGSYQRGQTPIASSRFLSADNPIIFPSLQQPQDRYVSGVFYEGIMPPPIEQRFRFEMGAGAVSFSGGHKRRQAEKFDREWQDEQDEIHTHRNTPQLSTLIKIKKRLEEFAQRQGAAFGAAVEKGFFGETVKDLKQALGHQLKQGLETEKMGLLLQVIEGVKESLDKIEAVRPGFSRNPVGEKYLRELSEKILNGDFQEARFLLNKFKEAVQEYVYQKQLMDVLLVLNPIEESLEKRFCDFWLTSELSQLIGDDAQRFLVKFKSFTGYLRADHFELAKGWTEQFLPVSRERLKRLEIAQELHNWIVELKKIFDTSDNQQFLQDQNLVKKVNQMMVAVTSLLPESKEDPEPSHDRFFKRKGKVKYSGPRGFGVPDDED